MCEGQKVCIATTAYDRPDDTYTFSISSSREALHNAGIQTAYYLLSGNCHVDDARNRIIQEFLASDCTDLVFIDADVSWRDADLVKLCQYDVDVVGATYPYRREDKKDDMPIRMLMNGGKSVKGLIEVAGMPTGFLRFKRHVIEQLVLKCEKFDGNNGHSSMQPLLFQRTLDPNGVRWGGDLHVCNLWRRMGGHVYCDPEIILGHAAKVIYTDSFGAMQRRNAGTTLSHVDRKIRAGEWTVDDLDEAIKYVDNPWSAPPEVLAVAVAAAAQADKPIVESGSGLSTILMAAATDQMVYCMEHDKRYIAKLVAMANAAEVTNIAIVETEIVNGFYNIDELPEDDFSIFLNDGPPRAMGSRMTGMHLLGYRADLIICDDADNRDYREKLESWGVRAMYVPTHIQPRALVLKRHGNS